MDPEVEPAARAAPAAARVFRVQLGQPGPALERAPDVLSAAELERAARFHFDRHRGRFVASRVALRDLLARHLRCEPADLDFEAGPQGKPALPGDPVHFNLSRSEDLCLVALSDDAPLGVDVEYRREDPYLLKVARRFFSDPEVEGLHGLAADEQLPAFFRVWSRKEAYIKALGLGLSLPLDSFDVSLEPGDGARLVATRHEPEALGRWSLQALDVHPDYAAALCLRGVFETPAIEGYQAAGGGA